MMIVSIMTALYICIGFFIGYKVGRCESLPNNYTKKTKERRKQKEESEEEERIKEEKQKVKEINEFIDNYDGK